MLSVTATGESVTAATATVYAAIEKVSFADGIFRRDIGHREIQREKARDKDARKRAGGETP